VHPRKHKPELKTKPDMKEVERADRIRAGLPLRERE
jgi:hypothetical protein